MEGVEGFVVKNDLAISLVFVSSEPVGDFDDYFLVSELKRLLFDLLFEVQTDCY